MACFQNRRFLLDLYLGGQNRHRLIHHLDHFRQRCL